MTRLPCAARIGLCGRSRRWCWSGPSARTSYCCWSPPHLRPSLRHRSRSGSQPQPSGSASCTTQTTARYSRSRIVNRLAAHSLDLIGGSSYVWAAKHLAHHTYTNVADHDPDIDALPFARFEPSQRRRCWHRYQHVYVWVLYAFVTVRWQVITDPVFLIRGSVGRSPLPAARRVEPGGTDRRQGVLRHLGDRNPAGASSGCRGRRLLCAGVCRRVARIDGHVPARALHRRDGHPAVREHRQPGVARAPGAYDVGLRPPQRGGRVVRRRPQLPDRAPPVPPRPAHRAPTAGSHSPGNCARVRRVL